MNLFLDHDDEPAIPRRLFRIWLGPNQVKPLFEGWWQELLAMHPGWESLTIRDADVDRFVVPGSPARAVYDDCRTQSGRSDVLRVAALYELGGIYVDVDCLPVRSLEPLLEGGPFVGKRSGRSLNCAVLGAPTRHQAVLDLLEVLPDWYRRNYTSNRYGSNGPQWVTEGWWEHPRVRMLPVEAFYALNRNFKTAEERRAIDEAFARRDFPAGAYLVHYSDHNFGTVR